MKIEKFSQTYLDSILDREKFPEVSGTLETLRVGRPPTPRTPLYKDLSQDEIFDKWKSILTREASKFPRLVDYDLSRMTKVGPQGGYPPLSERMDSFENYYKPGVIKMDEAIREELITKTRDILFGSEANKRPLSYESVLKIDIDSDKLNTNSGCPSYGKRTDTLIQQRAVRDAHSGKWRDYPAILGSRSQRGKDRFIFMFPFSTNLVEKSFLIPLMDIIRKRNVSSFSAWEGFDVVENTMDKQGFFKGYKSLISLDYTKMDQHCGEDFTQLVYDIVAPVFQARFRPLLKEVMFHTNNIPVLIGMDKIATGSHGLASGSGFTNFNESVFSQFVHLLIGKKLGIEIAKNQILGDDAVMSLPITYEMLPEVIAEAGYEVGQEFNPGKQEVSETNCTYLQRFFDIDISVKGTNVVAGCYPSILAINSAINPERFHDARKWNEKMEILRWIMILENCNHSPYFEQLIEFFIEGDKFKLGLIIPGFLKRGIVSTYEEAQSINGFVPSYNQTHIDKGILEFDVVRYLRSRSS